MLNRTPHFYTCTPLGCLYLLRAALKSQLTPDIPPRLQPPVLSTQALLSETKTLVEGKTVAMCGVSNIVGMPLALLLKNLNATVTLCHVKTQNIAEEVRKADIVVTATRNAGYFKGEWFKEGAIAIDVGINEVWEQPNKNEGSSSSSSSAEEELGLNL
jgi:5,10-methylene-tetrahydrofolate dehydrogenase/methenyl tetrahydrofolate cyclohydrolase